MYGIFFFSRTALAICTFGEIIIPYKFQKYLIYLFENVMSIFIGAVVNMYNALGIIKGPLFLISFLLSIYTRGGEQQAPGPYL